MFSENFLEEGLVIRAGAGQAEILLNASASCPGCAAKFLCRSADQAARTLVAADPLGVQPGERVTIQISAGSLLRASLQLYGVLLLLLLAGLVFGLLFLDQLAAALLALGLPAAYGLALLLYTRRRSLKPLITARIVAISLD